MTDRAESVKRLVRAVVRTSCNQTETPCEGNQDAYIEALNTLYAAIDALANAEPAAAGERVAWPNPCPICHASPPCQHSHPSPAAQQASMPSSHWRQAGQTDPHGARYNCERAALCAGNLTDDEVANAVFMDPSIANTTAAKDRIRWLSRALETAIAQQAAPAAPEVRDALADVFALIDEGWLVRNIVDDANPGFAFRQLNSVRRLAKAHAALAPPIAAPGQEKP